MLKFKCLNLSSFAGVFILGLCGCSGGIEATGLVETEEGPGLKNGVYLCDSTENGAGDYLKFEIWKGEIKGEYQSMDDVDFYSDTLLENRGTFYGTYQISSSELTIVGTFRKPATISGRDTLERVSAYMTDGYPSYLIDSLPYSVDTLRGFSGTLHSSKIAYRYGSQATIDASKIDTNLTLTNAKLVWDTAYLTRSSPSRRDTIVVQDSFSFTEIKGDFNSNFRIRMVSYSGGFDFTGTRYWLYCRAL